MSRDVKPSDRLPGSVLGRFLEWSVPTNDIRASLSFYEKLGFSQAPVGEAWNHPYAVVTDGRVFIGLHQDADFAPSMTFAKPDLLKHLRHLEELGMTLEFRRLGNDVFNEVGWLDPEGHLLRLVEARTFSPPKRASTDRSSCGYFLEIALPAAAPDAAKAYWERLGFVGMDETTAPLPHISCTSDTINIGLYEPALLRAAALLFEVEDFEATLAVLTGLDVAPSKRIPAALKNLSTTLIEAPEGTSILLMANGF